MHITPVGTTAHASQGTCFGPHCYSSKNRMTRAALINRLKNCINIEGENYSSYADTVLAEVCLIVETLSMRTINT